jgi:pyruvate formate lyase activating enzyme
VAFVKTSLIDFPGRVASVLFLPGCNFRCPYCHNAELVQPDGGGEGASAGSPSGFATLGEFFDFLDKRKTLISGVVISGGEPLLHEETPRIARSIRERGLAVKLDTNGSFPARIAEVAADYVALDFKTAPSKYGLVAPAMPGAGEKFLESLAYLRSSGTPFELRITCAPGIVGPPEIEAMALHLEEGDEVLLQDFRPEGCLDPAWDSVEPYPRETMEGFLAIVRRRAPDARIRGG